jgi:hydrogenase nickel incorporation protein HypA/HybF
MHELTVAQNIIELVKESVPEKDYSRIKEISINAGLLSNISTESLLFCFNSIKEKTGFPSAELLVEQIPVSIRCHECSRITTGFDYIFNCNCGSGNIEVLSGHELNLSRIILE